MGINHKLIEDFLEYKTASGASKQRLISLGHNLRWLDNATNQPFQRFTPKDLQKILVKIETSGQQEWTRYLRKAVLMQLLRYALKDKHPPILEDIHLKQPKDKLVKADLLTYPEVKRLIEASPPNWAALIAVIYDGNFRRKEALSCKIGDLHLYDNYAELSYRDSKQNLGTKILTISVPYLIDWLNRHPTKDDPQTALFQTYHKTWRKWLPITPAALLQNLKRTVKKAGLKKRVYPHLLRHSRTTRLQNKST